MALRAVGSVFFRGSVRSAGSLGIVFEKAVQSAAGKGSNPPVLASCQPRYLAGAANSHGDSDLTLHRYLTGKGNPHGSGGVAGGGVLLAVTTMSTLLGMWLASPGGTSAKGAGISGEEKVPESVDWVKEGAVTTPQDQCICGGCWAYASVGSMEGLNMIKNGKLVNLSVQQVLDCAKRIMRRNGDVQVVIGQGCSGGKLYHAFEYAKTHGLMAAKSYPSRLLWHGRCRSREKDVVLKIDDYDYVNSNEEALMRAVAKQPVAVPIDVCPYLRGFRGDGIIEYHHCPPAASGTPGARSHAVLVVGYGTDKEGNKFWVIKNSWGIRWGNGGFAKLRRGVADKNGVAGITRYLGYVPIIECNKETN